jgi:hypothetical protein
MAMGMSSKFGRMKLKPSDRMKPMKKMVPAPGPTGGGAGGPQPAGTYTPIKKRIPAMDPRVAARKKAMQKMGDRYGK